MGNKTFKVGIAFARFQFQLDRSDNDQDRKWLCSHIESLLHSSENYRGFGYTMQKVERKNGKTEVINFKEDEYKRTYGVSSTIQADYRKEADKIEKDEYITI